MPAALAACERASAAPAPIPPSAEPAARRDWGDMDVDALLLEVAQLIDRLSE